jgi:hypothetical protein
VSPRTRSVQTLAGPVRYVDSGWTEQEWWEIERMMARCVAPDRFNPRVRRAKAKPKRGVPRRSDQLTVWDISEHTRLDDELSDRLSRD